ncbi:HAD family hydrolase [Streptomyces sp. NPDC006879]|uniref:HAD family hydrolase n=1 Tax=Streptomyces sp. NPDC006879 TaxID=3364767 RepID=UPI0036A27885
MKPLRAVVLDTDGVLLDSAALHAQAWKEAFDGCLAEACAAGGPPQAPFDAEREYRELVDGKSRLDGALAFLESRGIELPLGTPQDPPGCATVWAVAGRKEQAFTRSLRAGGVEPFPEVRPALQQARSHGLRCAAVSASRHARDLLASAGLTDLFDETVDGVDAARLKLPGKPDPALFLTAAARLRVDPAESAVVEDALAGVEAGQRGGFAMVVGVDRTGAVRSGAALRAHGAGAVAEDLLAVVRELIGERP